MERSQDCLGWISRTTSCSSSTTLRSGAAQWDRKTRSPRYVHLFTLLVPYECWAHSQTPGTLLKLTIAPWVHLWTQCVSAPYGKYGSSNSTTSLCSLVFSDVTMITLNPKWWNITAHYCEDRSIFCCFLIPWTLIFPSWTRCTVVKMASVVINRYVSRATS